MTGADYDGWVSPGPERRIRPVALCLARRDDGAILVAPGYDSEKRQRFYRPLGGEIEFGERAAEAARREMREELNAAVDDLRLLLVSENLFSFQGQAGHELVWVYEGRLRNEALYDADVVIAHEGPDAFEAHWVQLEVFLRGEAPLYPDGLLAALTSPRGDV